MACPNCGETKDQIKQVDGALECQSCGTNYDVEETGMAIHDSLEDFGEYVRRYFPLAQVEEDNDGQLVIYSGLKADTNGKVVEMNDDPVIESPSGWSYRASQENGDEVDCPECGNALNDDLPIVNDGEGYAYHERCLHRPLEQELPDACNSCGSNQDLQYVEGGPFCGTCLTSEFMLEKALWSDNPLFTWMDRVRDRYRNGEITPGEQITSPFGIHGTYESVDEDGDVYLMVGFVLPDSWYAEIEDGTYGQLQGFRIYKRSEID